MSAYLVATTGNAYLSVLENKIGFEGVFEESEVVVAVVVDGLGRDVGTCFLIACEVEETLAPIDCALIDGLDRLTRRLGAAARMGTQSWSSGKRCEAQNCLRHF